MTITTRPATIHWITAALAVLGIALVAFVPVAFIAAQIVPVEQRLVGACVGTVLLVLLLLPLVIRSGRAARWSVDVGGLNSPVIGRIAFDDVTSMHVGYPRSESVPMTVFQSVVAPGSRTTLDETLVLRLADGRMLPVNLLSPSIHGGRTLMSKLEELLAGKRHSNGMFSQAEIAALKSRPMNRIVVPKSAQLGTRAY